jgi:hypothetical protein
LLRHSFEHNGERAQAPEGFDGLVRPLDGVAHRKAGATARLPREGGSESIPATCCPDERGGPMRLFPRLLGSVALPLLYGRKIHFGIDWETLEIWTVEITSSDVRNTPMLPERSAQISTDQDIASVTADGAYALPKSCRNVIAPYQTAGSAPDVAKL